jgi:hypothetical protein
MKGKAKYKKAKGVPKQVAAENRGKNKKKGKAKALSTTFDPSNPKHMATEIDLSNFKNKSFKSVLFKEFAESIIDMRALQALVLQNNGIGDKHVESLELVFFNTNIRKIDLRGNLIGKACAAYIGKMLREISHLEWLDLSRNCFSSYEKPLKIIAQGLKKQKGLQHLCIDINLRDVGTPSLINVSEASTKSKQDKMVDVYVKLLHSQPKIRSMALIDTKINKWGMANVARALDPVVKKPPKKTDQLAGGQEKKSKGFFHARNVNGLSFKYCYLQLVEVRILCLALKVNRTLIKLDLSNNAMSSVSGSLINAALRENQTLMDLNLSRNKLCDIFAEGLAGSLRINCTLQKCDISGNCITKVGSKKILDAINSTNQTIESLGDISA